MIRARSSDDRALRARCARRGSSRPTSPPCCWSEGPPGSAGRADDHRGAQPADPRRRAPQDAVALGRRRWPPNSAWRRERRGPARRPAGPAVAGCAASADCSPRRPRRTRRPTRPRRGGRSGHCLGAGWIGGSAADNGPRPGRRFRRHADPAGLRPTRRRTPYEPSRPVRAAVRRGAPPEAPRHCRRTRAGQRPHRIATAARRAGSGHDYGAPPPQPALRSTVVHRLRPRSAVSRARDACRSSRRRWRCSCCSPGPHLRPPAAGLGPTVQAGSSPPPAPAPGAGPAAHRATARRRRSRPIPAVLGESRWAAPGLVAIAPNGTFAYVANLGAGVVTVVDTAIDNLVATIPIPDGPPQYLGSHPTARGSTSACSTTRTPRRRGRRARHRPRPR